MKRAAGAGRKPMLGGPLSRQKDFKCPVMNCSVTGRSDNVIRHLKQEAQFEENGMPVRCNSKWASSSNASHTKYFIDNKYTLSSELKLKKLMPTVENPFTVAATAAKKKKKTADSDTNEKKAATDAINVSEEIPVSQLESKNRSEAVLIIDQSESLETIFPEQETVSYSEHNLLTTQQNDIHTSSQLEVENTSDAVTNIDQSESLEAIFPEQEMVSNSEHNLLTTQPKDSNASSQVEAEIPPDAVSNIDQREILESVLPEQEILSNPEHDLVASQNNDINTSLVKTIGTEILSKLGISDGESLVEAVANAVVNKLNTPKTDSFSEEEIKDLWTDSGDKVLCEACVTIVSTMKNKIPLHLHSNIRGEYGAIKKGEHLQRSKEIHVKSPLHFWCKQEYSKVSANKGNNINIAEKLVTNATYVIKTFGSAKDFVRLNEKDNILTQENATKNDGPVDFFHIRELLFSEISNELKIYFKNNVKQFTVTLDKVSDRGTPYTVIVTYFFAEGKIYMILNSIYEMTSNDYDGPGTAKMVADVLMETLGISKEVLSKRCHHFVYDGVYASSEERKGNRGGLSLRHQFAKYLDISVEDITGNHDLSHNMQLSYSDIFKDGSDGPNNSLIKEVFNIMSLHKYGKAGVLFNNAASDLGHVVLTNKCFQETRFVAATLRGLNTFLVNLPTIHHLHATDFAKCNDELNQTGAKSALKLMGKLSDPKTISMIIGFCQFFNEVCSMFSCFPIC